MNQYAVMGNPISHSLSPLIHHFFAKQTGIALQYDKIEVPIPLFEQYVFNFFKRPESKGLNITLPFKERSFNMADWKSPQSQEAGAANTLWFKEGKLFADNTDGIGLIRDLKHYIELPNKTILLLGAGGAARGILGSLLASRPKAIILSNRSMDKAVALKKMFPSIITCGLDALTDAYDIIINATSASLQEKNMQLPENILANHPFCYDLAYNTTHKTPFVQWAINHGSQAVDGIGMLIEQAAEAFNIWHHVMPDTSSCKKQLKS